MMERGTSAGKRSGRKTRYHLLATDGGIVADQPVYRWINENLDDDVGREVDKFVDERLAEMYPDDVVPVFAALAGDSDGRLRTIAAIGLHRVYAHAPDEAVRIAGLLLDDPDEAVAAQTRETLRDLPSLLDELS